MHPKDIEPFLTHLTVEKHVAISTQKTALNALVLLFREFLGLDVGQLNFGKAKRPRKLPTVLSLAEATAVIQRLTGVHKLIVQLKYGSGLRIMEGARLRMKDVDFSQSGLMRVERVSRSVSLAIRFGTPLPRSSCAKVAT